jgi:hypothetical protein
MPRFTILTMTLMLTSPIYADDNEPYYYSCNAKDFPCEGLQKGDLLRFIDTDRAVLYCDATRPILEGSGIKKYSCIYNGNKYKNLAPVIAR